MAKKHQVRSSKRDAKQRRAQLEQIKRNQQRAERRRTALTIVGASVIGLALVGATFYAKWEPSRIGHVAGASSAAKKAGCTGVRNDGAKGRGHKTADVPYAATPPSSGPHNPDPLPDTPAFYARDVTVTHLVERAVHNLEHGFIVGWYDPQLPQKQVDALKAAAAGTTRFVAVPWSRSTFSGGKHFVLTSWQRTQRCDTVSAAMISEYTAKYTDSKQAPEAGGTGGTAVTPSPSATPSPTGKPTGKPTPTPSRAAGTPTPTPSK